MAQGYFICLCCSFPGALHPLLSQVFPTGSADPPASLLPTYKELYTSQVLHFLRTKSFPPVLMLPLRQSSLSCFPQLQTTPLWLCHARATAPSQKWSGMAQRFLLGHTACLEAQGKLKYDMIKLVCRVAKGKSVLLPCLQHLDKVRSKHLAMSD